MHRLDHHLLKAVRSLVVPKSGDLLAATATKSDHRLTTALALQPTPAAATGTGIPTKLHPLSAQPPVAASLPDQPPAGSKHATTSHVAQPLPPAPPTAASNTTPLRPIQSLYPIASSTQSKKNQTSGINILFATFMNMINIE